MPVRRLRCMTTRCRAAQDAAGAAAAWCIDRPCDMGQPRADRGCGNGLAMVPRTGLEPVRCRQASVGFSYPPRFSPPHDYACVWGLECALAMAPCLNRMCRQAPAVHSLHLPGIRAWLGVASQVERHAGGSPNLTGFTPGVSSPGAQISSPMRLPISPPGHGGQCMRRSGFRSRGRRASCPRRARIQPISAGGRARSRFRRWRCCGTLVPPCCPWRYCLLLTAGQTDRQS